jgi:hypothetical protein
MSHKLAIDFGTTNSVLACWNDEASRAEILAILGLSADWQDNRRPLVPSLLYVQDGRSGQVTIGQAVLDGGLDRQRSNRLFRGFKRGITAGPLLEPRLIDGASWTDRDAGCHFLHALLQALPFPSHEIEQLAVTVPVTAFEGYAAWLADTLSSDLTDRIRLVDWQQWGIGVGPWDAAYLLALFWPPERRAELEQPLMQTYHGRVQAYGGMEYDWQACWHDYRLGAIKNLLVPFWAWADGTWTEHAEPHRWGQFERATCAFQNLNCEELLGEIF